MVASQFSERHTGKLEPFLSRAEFAYGVSHAQKHPIEDVLSSRQQVDLAAAAALANPFSLGPIHSPVCHGQIFKQELVLHGERHSWPAAGRQ